VAIHIKEDIFVVEVSDNAVGRTKRIAAAEKPLRAIGLVRVRIVRRVVSVTSIADFIGRHLKVASSRRRRASQG
jgi:hypothetical protein